MVILYFITIIILTIFLIFGKSWVSNPELNDFFRNIANAGVYTLIGVGLTKVYEQRSRIWLIFLANTLYRNRYIRVSAAYLFKICINGKYLLVKGRNINQFQPVGGVYKRMVNSDKLFSELDIRDDKNIPINETTKLDLRIRIKGRYLDKFLNWFDSRHDREITQWREFCEELVRTRLLTFDNFPHIYYRFLHQNPLYIHHSEFYNCPEILIHEVYELLPNEKQMAELKELLENEQPESLYRWVDEETIIRLGYKSDNIKLFAIAEHSNSLFNKKYRIK